MNYYAKSLVLLLFLVGANGLSAQVAVKAGVNFSNMLFEEDENSLEDLARNGAVKFTAGVVFILPIGDVVAVQPELLFVQKGAESTYKSLGQQVTNDLNYNYFDIPLLLRFSLGDTYGEGLGIYFNGGVYAGYAINGKSKTSSPLGTTETDFTFDSADDQRRLDFGLAAGGGLTLGNLFFDLRYVHGTNNLLDDDADNSNDGTFKKLQHRGLSLTAGLAF
jgi:hypothetical protein